MVTFSTCADFAGSIAPAHKAVQTAVAGDAAGACAPRPEETKKDSSARTKDLRIMKEAPHSHSRRYRVVALATSS